MHKKTSVVKAEGLDNSSDTNGKDYLLPLFPQLKQCASTSAINVDINFGSLYANEVYHDANVNKNGVRKNHNKSPDIIIDKPFDKIYDIASPVTLNDDNVSNEQYQNSNYLSVSLKVHDSPKHVIHDLYGDMQYEDTEIIVNADPIELVDQSDMVHETIMYKKNTPIWNVMHDKQAGDLLYSSYTPIYRVRKAVH